MDLTKLEPPLFSQNSFVSAARIEDGPKGAFLIISSLLFLVSSFMLISHFIRDFQSRQALDSVVT